jgi:hypothetical protein
MIILAIHQKSKFMKKIFIFALLFLIGHSGKAQSSGPISFNNMSPCDISVTLYAYGPAEGFDTCCASCSNNALVSLSYTIPSMSTPSFGSYYAVQTGPGWVGGVMLSSGLTDVQFVAVGYSYTCTGSYAGCGPPDGILSGTCTSCFGSTNTFSYTTGMGCPAHTFAGSFNPHCPMSPYVSPSILFW